MKISQRTGSELVEERIYLRLLAEVESERLLRGYVRESFRGVDNLMSEWDLALAYSKGSSLLSESQNVRGRLIVEGLFQSVAGAMQWAGEKVGKGVKAVIKAGGEAIDAAGKALMMLLEKIPGGKDAFEFLKEFTAEKADQIKEYVMDAVKEFGAFIEEKKSEILGSVFEAGSQDTGVMAKLEELIEKEKENFGEQVDKVKEWLANFKDNPIEAAKGFFNLRKILGVLVADVVEMILKKGGDVAKKIVGVFNAAGFTKSKLGMFFLRVLSFFSGDMGGEDTLEAAGQMWSSAMKLKTEKPDLERRLPALIAVIPRIIKGLVSGTSALEGIIRSAMGDPKALTELFKNAVKLVRKAISNLIAKGAAAVVKSVGIDPESKIGGIVISGMGGLVGEEED